MNPGNPRILTINGGSSSIKIALFAGAAMSKLFAGGIEGIGRGNGTMRISGEAVRDTFTREVKTPDYQAAVHLLMEWIVQRFSDEPLDAVGHRVVHGGLTYSAPQRLTPEVIAQLHGFCPFDPDHLPEELLVIEAFARRLPELAQFACFDTAFHHDLPRVARILPIPRRYDEQGLRRFGFHGLSYAYLMQELTRIAGAHLAGGRVILAHLGSGASLSAVHAGRPVDTSMGLTPNSGVPMGTRCGDLDPGLVAYLARSEGMDAERFDHMVNAESGLLGVSQISSDMRDLLAHEAHDVRAAEAIGLFCYQVKKCIGAFAAALGGLDCLVFAGGIGENVPVIRARICAGLEFLGIVLDESRNQSNHGVIAAQGSRVSVRVIPTDEASMIATTVCAQLRST